MWTQVSIEEPPAEAICCLGGDTVVDNFNTLLLGGEEASMPKYVNNSETISKAKFGRLKSH
jgi:hypothetical protein